MKSREVRKQQPEYSEVETKLSEDVPEDLDESPHATESLPQEEISPEVQRITELEEEASSLKDQYLRARAEFDNYRKRVERDQAAFRASATESLLRDMLPTMDNLELALQHQDGDAQGLVEGVNMVLKQMRDNLAQHGLSPIPATGEAFDPNVHEAMGQTPSDDVPADHVAEEYQRGYFLGDRVLRPSRVLVSSGKPEVADTETGESADTSDGAES